MNERHAQSLLQQMQAMAAELVHAGHALLKDAEPTDPAMLRHYRQYRDVLDIINNDGLSSA
jgi:hypothetical protein